MSGELDRLKAAFAELAKDPAAPFRAVYPGKIVKQSADGSTVDVVPDEQHLPGFKDIPLRVGIPGVVARVKAGTRCLVAFDNGQPDGAYASLADPGAGAGAAGTATISLEIHAAKVEIGGSGLVPLQDGLVLGRTPCAFTGAPHLSLGGTSTKVMAKP